MGFLSPLENNLYKKKNRAKRENAQPIVEKNDKVLKKYRVNELYSFKRLSR
ncbi:hypothetical protein SAMN05720489_3084 [Fibrobacter sp. UWB13]|nr:hypothetical protein SAMN05720489_3084 [Fibrobacter sp. UWB13]